MSPQELQDLPFHRWITFAAPQEPSGVELAIDVVDTRRASRGAPRGERVLREFASTPPGERAYVVGFETPAPCVRSAIEALARRPVPWRLRTTTFAALTFLAFTVMGTLAYYV